MAWWRCPAPALFFFQGEDGIRCHCVTGVQTCALPISTSHLRDRVQSREWLVVDDEVGIEGDGARERDPPRHAAGELRRHERRSEERRVGKECRTRWGAQD